MPKMDGLELRKRILVERPAIQVLMMSAYLDCRCGDVPFIAKPFSAAVLNARLRRLLESTAPSGA
jgi:DNA-binding response OmpR family regulator